MNTTTEAGWTIYRLLHRYLNLYDVEPGRTGKRGRAAFSSLRREPWDDQGYRPRSHSVHVRR